MTLQNGHKFPTMGLYLLELYLVLIPLLLPIPNFPYTVHSGFKQKQNQLTVVCYFVFIRYDQYRNKILNSNNMLYSQIQLLMCKQCLYEAECHNSHCWQSLPPFSAGKKMSRWQEVFLKSPSYSILFHFPSIPQILLPSQSCKRFQGK